MDTSCTADSFTPSALCILHIVRVGPRTSYPDTPIRRILSPSRFVSNVVKLCFKLCSVSSIQMGPYHRSVSQVILCPACITRYNAG